MYIIKKFNKDSNNNSIEYVDKLNISKFIPDGLKELIESLPDEMYILGVCYTTDNQICMSGKMKLYESPLASIKRELLEEMNISSNNIIFCKQIKNNIFYNLNIQNCNLNYSNKINTNIDLKNRVVCCVYGKYDNVINYMNKFKLNKNNEDNIVGIWASKKLNILNIINSM